MIRKVSKDEFKFYYNLGTLWQKKWTEWAPIFFTKMADKDGCITVETLKKKYLAWVKKGNQNLAAVLERPFRAMWYINVSKDGNRNKTGKSTITLGSKTYKINLVKGEHIDNWFKEVEKQFKELKRGGKVSMEERAKERKLREKITILEWKVFFTEITAKEAAK